MNLSTLQFRIVLRRKKKATLTHESVLALSTFASVLSISPGIFTIKMSLTSSPMSLVVKLSVSGSAPLESMSKQPSYHLMDRGN